MLQLTSFGSGSKGNCVLISNGKNNILIDAGLSPNVINKCLTQFSLTLYDIDGLLITHEHNDHIKSLGVLSQYIPVYSHPDTLAVAGHKVEIPLKQRMEIEPKTFGIGTLDITPFKTCHDAAFPYGYVIKDCDSSIAFLTDTGFVSKGAMSVISGCDMAFIESNHDKTMLMQGEYPQFLKQRILSDKGHLSNEECALTVSKLIENGTQKIMLAHLSEKNNLPELAFWTTAKYLQKLGIDKDSYTLKIASQYNMVAI
ncbi:MAG: MBL fold metallo-hydrolase [Clostridia bacterium]